MYEFCFEEFAEHGDILALINRMPTSFKFRSARFSPAARQIEFAFSFA